MLSASQTAADRETLNARGDRAASEIRDGIHNVKDDVRKTASAVRDNMEGFAHDAGAYVRNAAMSAEESLSQQVSDAPLKSVGIALLSGIVLGILIKR